jgi:hypothetical protein
MLRDLAGEKLYQAFPSNTVKIRIDILDDAASSEPTWRTRSSKGEDSTNLGLQ